MGILSRFGDIMSSNVNAILDKMEDPAKMIDQMLLNMNKDLAQVKVETAGVMAEESFMRQSAWMKNGCNSFNGRRAMSNPLSFWTLCAATHNSHYAESAVMLSRNK